VRTCPVPRVPRVCATCVPAPTTRMLESSNWRLGVSAESSACARADTDSRVAKSIASYKEALDKEMTSLKKSELKLKCHKESLASYRSGKFEEAMDSFVQYLALVESDSEQTVDPEMRATLYSNIAVCLHQLSEWDLATVYYDTALGIFGTVETDTAAWLYYGDIKQKKIDHISGQKELLKEKKKPGTTTYIDATGRRRPFAEKDSSYFSLTSWIAWYFPPDDSAAAPAAPAMPAP